MPVIAGVVIVGDAVTSGPEAEPPVASFARPKIEHFDRAVGPHLEYSRV